MSGDGKNGDDDQRAESEASESSKNRPDHASTPSQDRDVRVILDEMLESLRLIRGYTQGLSYEAFASEQLLQDGVVLRIAILGEAANHIPAEDQGRWPEVPWRILADMRNRLIHGYFAMRLDLVWQVVSVDLPILESQLRTARDSLT